MWFSPRTSGGHVGFRGHAKFMRISWFSLSCSVYPVMLADNKTADIETSQNDILFSRTPADIWRTWARVQHALKKLPFCLLFLFLFACLSRAEAVKSSKSDHYLSLLFRKGLLLFNACIARQGMQTSPILLTSQQLLSLSLLLLSCHQTCMFPKDQW